MKRHVNLVFGALSLTACALLTRTASAATLAFDSAADPVYDDGWQEGDNGGTGWGGGWTFDSPRPLERHFIGNSAGNGDGDTAPPAGDINTPRTPSGRAWGLANSTAPGAQSRVTLADRRFGGDLSVGQTFSVDFDHGTVTGGFPNSVGVALFDTVAGGRDFVWQFDITSDDGPFPTAYGIHAQEPTQFVRPATDEGLHLEFTLLSANRYRFTMTPLGGETTTVTGTLRASGRADVSPDGVRLYNLNGGNAAAGESFYNNMAIGQVPEPGVGCLGIAVSALALSRRRARRVASEPGALS